MLGQIERVAEGLCGIAAFADRGKIENGKAHDQGSEVRKNGSKCPTLNLQHPTSNGQECITCNKACALLIRVCAGGKIV
jgi:hypothetical protein